MDPAGREEMLELARDLSHNKQMSLFFLFSSHLLPNVEHVCDHVLVLGRGRLLLQGRIQELKGLHDRCYEVEVKADRRSFADHLREARCHVSEQDHGLLVQLPPAETPQLLWKLAGESGHQLRRLRPQRSTLEEVFLKALEEDNDVVTRE